MENAFMNSARAEEEADRITSNAARNLKEVFSSLRDCMQVVQSTRRTLEVDPECGCTNEVKWERRQELYDAAESIELLIRTSLDEIETNVMESLTCEETAPAHEDDTTANKQVRCHLEKLTVHEKVDMDSSLWCNLSQTLLELVFARLPLHHIFQLRVLSKQWRSSITSPTFQNAFGSTASRRSVRIVLLFAMLHQLSRLAWASAYELMSRTIPTVSPEHATVDGRLFWSSGMAFMSRPMHPCRCKVPKCMVDWFRAVAFVQMN
jgi:hypothetical protein